MRRKKQDYKVRELYELNPIRYKSERKKEFNRIIVRDENNTKRARRARRIKKIILTLMIIVGITFIIYPTILRYIGERSSQQLMEEFEDNLEDENEEEMDVEEEETKEPSSLSQEDADTLSKEEVIGIIKIEAIDIKYPILEGTSGDVLNKGIGHLSETAGIGAAGNCVLCGHNGSRSGTFFTPLNNVQIGDL
nr:sortase [Eubacterium sp.]